MSSTLEFKTKNLVNGLLIDAADGRKLDVVEPATEKVLAQVPASGPDDVEAAVQAAQEAFRVWRRTTPGERAEMLLALADAIDAHAEHLAILESRNVGKPLPVAREEIPFVADNVRFFAGAARCLEGRSGGEYLAGYESYIRREPIGVVAGIAPWNYPLLMAAWKFAPALAAGNCSVLKPARSTPLTALYLAHLAADIFPPGVFNVLAGSASDMGDSLVSDPRIGMISITGDTATGMNIARVAAQNVTKVHLELGGKAPVVVLDDADVEAVVEAVKVAGYVNSGQDCTSACRIIATPGIYDQLVEALVPAVQGLTMGDPGETEELDLGPVISAGHRDAILNFLDETDGEVVTGGRSQRATGYFVEPAVVVNPSQDDRLVQKEVFGPVVSVQRANDADQAFEWANDVEFGLASSVWTRDLSSAHRAIRELEFGCVWVNDHLPVVAEMPHGGFKKSGYGKDMSMYGLEDYTRIKHVMTKA